MFSNYLKISWRNIVKSKGYSLINIGGLSIGMAIAILIALWIFDEMSFNKYHKNYDKIGQVMVNSSFNNEGSTSISLPRPLEQEIRNKYGRNFKHIVMTRYEEEQILSVGETKISQPGRFMQPGGPAMLSLQMLSGTYDGLKDMSSILLSKSTATALFGNVDPLNKMIKIGSKMDVKVTGVYEDIPYNSDFSRLKFISTWDILMANNPWMMKAADKWGNNSFLMFVQIDDNTTFDKVSSSIKPAVINNVEADDKKFNQAVFVHPMSRWHLFSEFKNGINSGGAIQNVWLFGIIGAFVLLLACINFMNLSTARSEKRAREVGIRKAIGSRRKQLIYQFLAESFLVVMISFVFAMLLVTIALPWFNEVADKKMSMFWTQPLFWVSSLVFILFTSVISGSYPAFYLSSFNPVKVLKGTFQVGPYATLPRKVLVVAQFTVSVALIIGTIVVYRQIQHAKNRPVGYNRNGLVSVPIKTNELLEKYTVLNQELIDKKIATSTARSNSPLTGVWSNNGGFEWRDKDPNKVENFGTVWITHDYGKTVGWQFKEGRDFSRNFASDSVGPDSPPENIYNVIINEAAADYMGMKNPVGEILRWSGTRLNIIGVIKNVVAESPYNPVRQNIYLVGPSRADAWLNIRINPSMSVSDALSRMETVFKKLAPSAPFEYKFADSEYAGKFIGEERIGKLAALFASLAILISCLGLFGLASFVAEKRTKEIGIRKVLGATVFNLWNMLSKDFVALILLACVLAAPLSYYFLNGWLQQFQYRTTISWWIFGVAVSGSIIITLLTVSFQAIKAALLNPVKSLRSE